MTALNRVKVVTNTVGTGDVTLGATLPAQQTMANAGAVNGQTYTYLIVDGNDWELGPGIYTAAGPSISRAVDTDPAFMSSTGTNLNLSGNAIVSIIQSAHDINNINANVGMVLLDEIVTAGSQATIDFTGISSAYRHLRVIFAGRGDTAAFNTNLHMRFNNDSAFNYDAQYLNSQNGVVSAGQILGSSYMFVGSIIAANGPANFRDQNIIDIADYNSVTFNKSANSYGTIRVNADRYTVNCAGWWNDTDNITQVNLFLAAGNFVNGSVASLYGIK